VTHRLAARPDPSVPAAAAGRFEVAIDGRRPMYFDVPDDDRPVPLVVMLHGAGGDARQAMAVLAEPARRRGCAVLAPASLGPTWDILVEGRYGPDVEAIDAALAEVFLRHPIDPGRIALAGFSDGASYALGVGLANGDLVEAILAFSPGFAAPASTVGQPRLFVCHGRTDQILPIDRTSRQVVPQLRQHGHEVVYEEFDDGHVIPATCVEQALDWFTGG
jgi:phospholipase/carboxylesterase